MSADKLQCKWCRSGQIIRYGGKGNKQLWHCKSCRKSFYFGLKKEKKEKPLLFNYSLGYIIGVLVGDGSLSKWRDYHYFDDKFRQVPKSKATKIVPRYRYGLQLLVKDKDFAETFAKHLQIISGRNVSHYPVTCKEVTEIAGNKLSKPYSFHGFRVQQTNKELYKKLLPLKEDLTWIYDANDDVKTGFLGGFFDSDGGTEKGRARITLTKKDIKLLELTRSLLEEFEIYSNIYSCPSWKGISRIYITGLDTNKFHNKIGFSIKRKKLGKIVNVLAPELL